MNEKRQLDALTGLRFVAALTVFIHHLGGKFGIGLNGYSIGSLAVTFFFVLSGFILTYVYHERLGSFADVKRFFFNRFARIWPLHVVCLLISGILLNKGSLAWMVDADQLPMLLTNLFLLQSWVPDNAWVFSFNGVSWSISTEAFFYAVFPWLAYGAMRNTNTRLALAILVVILAAGVLYWASRIEFWGWDFYRLGHVNPLIRLPEFCVGIASGKLFLSRDQGVARNSFWLDSAKEILVLSSIVFAAILVVEYRLQFVIANAAWGSQFLASWFRVAYPALLFGIGIYLFAFSGGVVSWLCSRRTMVYLGDVSYAFYMIHFVVIRQANWYAISYGELNGIQIAALAFGISLGTSILLYELVEMPAKNVLRNLVYGNPTSGINLLGQRLFLKAIVALVCLIGCAWTLKEHKSDLGRSPESSTVLSAAIPQTRQIDFGSEYRLQGCSSQSKGKNLKLKLVWVKRIEARRIRWIGSGVSSEPTRYRRLVLLLDENDKQIARANHNQRAFNQAEIGKEFLDEAFIPYARLQEAESVVVCFREKGFAALECKRGRRKQRGRQLVLLDRDEIQEILLNRE